MSTRNFHKTIQVPSVRHANDYQYWQDEIFEKTGIQCTVKLTDKEISIRALSYRDFLLAMNSIKGMTSLPIINDKQGAGANPIDSATPFH